MEYGARGSMRKFSGARGAPTFRAPAGATRWGERERVGEESEREWGTRSIPSGNKRRATKHRDARHAARRNMRIFVRTAEPEVERAALLIAALRAAPRRADRVSRLKRLLEGDGVSLARNYVQADRNERSEARRDTNASRFGA